MHTLSTTYCTFCEIVNTAFKATKDAFVKTSRYRKTYNELSALSDYELRDMCIARGDIEAISRGENITRYRL